MVFFRQFSTGDQGVNLVTFGGSGGSTLLTFVKDFVTFGGVRRVNFGDLSD